MCHRSYMPRLLSWLPFCSALDAENVVSDKPQLPRWSLNAPLGWVPELEEQQVLHGQGEPTLPTGRLGARDHHRLLGLAGH